MNHFLTNHPPTSEAALLSRCEAIEGMSFSQLAHALMIFIPDLPSMRKGWAGLAIERALGTTAGTRPMADFCSLGIELKTVPLNHLGQPAESTFVTSIPLLTIHKQNWKTSTCYLKLKRVLWIPVEGDVRIAFPYRRIGRAVLWSPSEAEESVLARDWTEFSHMIGLGRLSEVDARMGDYLQVRPKAATGRSLCYGFDELGNKVQTLPRGFYLRAQYTAKLITGLPG